MRHISDRTPRLPRVLFVDHSGLPGGGQIGLARFLERTRFDDVHVVLLSPGHAFDDVTRKRGFPLDILEHGSGPRSLFATRAALRRKIAALRPDVVVANSNKAALVLASLPKLRTTTTVYYMRDDLNPARKSFPKRVLLGRWMIPRFDEIIANSRWTASTIPQARIRQQARIAYPVCGTDNIQPRRPEDTPSPLRILSLSRIASWKGIHMMLEAARILESRGMAERFSMTIAGSSTHEDPNYEREMWRLGDKLESPVSFPGHVDNVQPLLTDHDVLLACSISTEPFGQVIVQGLNAGLITIASAEGGPMEIVDHEQTGYLVDPGDAERLADLLESLIINPQIRVRMSQAAMSSASRFSDSTTVDRLDEVLCSRVSARTDHPRPQSARARRDAHQG